MKGIHPREPRNRKRAQKGDLTKIKTLFHEKDIRFLLHEPIVWKFRDFKVGKGRLGGARNWSVETPSPCFRCSSRS